MKFEGSEAGDLLAVAPPLPALTLGRLFGPCGLLALPVRLRLAETLAVPGRPLALFDGELAALPVPPTPAARAEVVALVAGALPEQVMATPLADLALGEVLPLLAGLPGAIETADLAQSLARALQVKGVTTWQALATCRLSEIAAWGRVRKAALSALLRTSFRAAATAATATSAGIPCRSPPWTDSPISPSSCGTSASARGAMPGCWMRSPVCRRQMSPRWYERPPVGCSASPRPWRRRSAGVPVRRSAHRRGGRAARATGAHPGPDRLRASLPGPGCPSRRGRPRPRRGQRAGSPATDAGGDPSQTSVGGGTGALRRRWRSSATSSALHPPRCGRASPRIGWVSPP